MGIVRWLDLLVQDVRYAVVPTIALVAGIACALPAWRASRLDPALVFRDSP